MARPLARSSSANAARPSTASRSVRSHWPPPAMSSALEDRPRARDERLEFLKSHSQIGLLEGSEELMVAELPHRPGVLAAYRSDAARERSPERLHLDRRCMPSCPILEGEDRLRLLNYQNNLIGRIENLHGLHQLVFLDLYDNKVERLENLEAVPNLKVLMLGKNQVAHIENLAALTRLDVLDLHSNMISEISGLECLTSLRVLNLAGNSIREVSNMDGLVSLTELNIRRNELTSMSGIGVMRSLQRIFASRNRVATLLGLEPLKHLPCLSDLALDGNPVCDLEAYQASISSLCPLLGRTADQREEASRYEAEICDASQADAIPAADSRHVESSHPEVIEVAETRRRDELSATAEGSQIPVQCDESSLAAQNARSSLDNVSLPGRPASATGARPSGAPSAALGRLPSAGASRTATLASGSALIAGSSHARQLDRKIVALPAGAGCSSLTRLPSAGGSRTSLGTAAGSANRPGSLNLPRNWQGGSVANAEGRSREKRPCSAGANRQVLDELPTAAPAVQTISRSWSRSGTAETRTAAAGGGTLDESKVQELGAGGGSSGSRQKQLSSQDVLQEIRSQWLQAVAAGRTPSTRYGYVRREQPNELSVYGRGLEALDKPEYQSVITSIHFNFIAVTSVLHDISRLLKFQGLSSIAFCHNQIVSFVQLEALRWLPALTALAISENPICDTRSALRIQAMRCLPSLQFFNGREFTEAERSAAEQIFAPFDRVQSAEILPSPSKSDRKEAPSLQPHISALVDGLVSHACTVDEKLSVVHIHFEAAVRELIREAWDEALAAESGDDGACWELGVRVTP